MYVPAHFNETDPAVIERLIRDNGFALLVSGSGADLVATHLPLTYHPAEGVLRGHVARANGHWHHFEAAGPALAVFSGPHAYVSPRWYQPAPSVPTWNYEAVHVYGTVRLLDGEAALRPILEELSAQYDPRWSMADLPPHYVTSMTRGIVGIELAIERIEAKRKLSQNRAAADVEGVIAALQPGNDTDRAVAAAMRQAEGRRART